MGGGWALEGVRHRRRIARLADEVWSDPRVRWRPIGVILAARPIARGFSPADEPILRTVSTLIGFLARSHP